jgi:hypothetical protein
MMADIYAERTLGHSPKVVWPGFAVAALGAALVALGELFDSPKLRAVGLGALGSSVLTAGLGYIAPPGAVVPPDHDVTDIHEHDEPPRRVSQTAEPPDATGEPTATAPAEPPLP